MRQVRESYSKLADGLNAAILAGELIGVGFAADIIGVSDVTIYKWMENKDTAPDGSKRAYYGLPYLRLSITAGRGLVILLDTAVLLDWLTENEKTKEANRLTNWRDNK